MLYHLGKHQTSQLMTFLEMIVVEIKSSNEIPVKKIKIANENQLDNGNLKKLYLCTNEIKRNLVYGYTLYDKVDVLKQF